MPKANILIVEDEAVVAADLAGKLERAGYRPIGIVADGEEAIEIANTMAPDLVLMDIRLAGPMDGIKAAERIRALRSVPIVYLTAHSDPNTLQRARTTEPFGYVLKPFEERDLTTQIEIALYKHEAEQALRESEERYRTLVETAMDSILTIDQSGVILSCNAATERMFGYRSEDMLGRNVSMLMPGWLRDSQDEEAADAPRTDLRRARGLWRELKGQRRHGEIFPVEIAVSETFIGDDVLYTGILRDVSERKRAETELRWRAGLLEQAHEAIIIWRMGNGIIYWNHGATELYGWTPAEAAGRHCHQLLQTALPVPEQEFDRQLTESGQWYGEIQHRTKEGKVVVVESRMVTMSDDQEGTLVMETNRDVTDRHAIHQKVCRLAEELEYRVEERTQELVRSQELLRRLASELTIAEQRERRKVATDLHDYLAQLLVCVRLKVSQARSRQSQPETETWLREAEDVLQQSLTYTRSLVAQLAPMMLNEFGLPTALKWLVEQMQRYQLNVSLEVDDAEPARLPEDKAILMFQSVRELLMNVSKHAMVDRATVRMSVVADSLQILVQDDGRGFDQAEFGLLADEGAPAAQSNLAKFGLFSIRERMKALGGRLDFESRPGRGTTATLVLPLASQTTRDASRVTSDELTGRAFSHRASARSESSDNSHASLIRVLLVDDHAMMRQGLRGMLEGDEELTVVGEAGDGLEAIALAVALQPDVIIMDINMPKMDGVEATKRIKTRLPSTRVIGLSMHSSSHHLDAMKNAGAFAYLTKESVPEQLKKTILACRRNDGTGPWLDGKGDIPSLLIGGDATAAPLQPQNRAV